MIAQMVLGLVAIPFFVLVSVWTDWSFGDRLAVTIALGMGWLWLTYRNIKGLWYGFLFGADRVGQQP